MLTSIFVRTDIFVLFYEEKRGHPKFFVNFCAYFNCHLHMIDSLLFFTYKNAYYTDFRLSHTTYSVVVHLIKPCVLEQGVGPILCQLVV